MIILFTSENVAGAGIAAKLVAKHGFRHAGENELVRGGGRLRGNVWLREGVHLIDTKAPTVLEVPTDFETDCLLVLSTHRSKIPGRMLTAHVPGNWAGAEMGGKPRTLNTAPASRLKVLLQELKKEGDRIGWPVSLEADHHGPTCRTPILFVEIGNGETEWRDEKATEAVANAVARFLERDAKKETYETVFGVGGGHYPKTFTRLALESQVAVGHILPKYAIDALDAEMFGQAIAKNVEKLSRVLIAKEETNAAQKEKVRKLAEGAGIAVELV